MALSVHRFFSLTATGSSEILALNSSTSTRLLSSPLYSTDLKRFTDVHAVIVNSNRSPAIRKLNFLILICFWLPGKLIPEYHGYKRVVRMLDTDDFHLLHELLWITFKMRGTVERHSILIQILLVSIDAPGSTQITYNQIIHRLQFSM